MKARLLFPRLALPLALLALAGCALGPDYRRPAVTAPAFKESGDWQPAAPAAEQPRGKWWEAFGDPVLNDLQDKLEANSNTLLAAQAQYRQVLDAVTVAYSALYPAVNATGSATRDRSAAKNATPAQIQNSFGAGLAASWELDLWGTVRRGLEAGRATAAASAADLESVRLSLHATLAQTYFSLRVADTQQRLYDRTVAEYARSLQMTHNRYAAGVDTRADVATAEAQLKTAQAQAIDLSLTRAQLEHAIAVLLGQPPAGFSLAPADLSVAPPAVPALIPSQQLERRPDIAAAERRLAAASAGIGIAQGGYFPVISLTGSAGYSGSKLAGLFSTPNEIWSVGGSALAPLFNAGKTRAQVAAAHAAYEASLATYRQTVLTAFQEVEDNLAATNLLAREAAVQDEAVAAARQSTAITLNQYKAGAISYLEVVTAQSTQLTAERTAVQLLGRRLNAGVTLLKAAGGDWHDAAGVAPAAK
ncbi:efflux transporter outer membrane subunit [Opitutus sp. GAS368]|jgi:NodT family efflux transporter outer membrane factor (OMF) lipoprotein|uniref:efflux transporter outer membrane subunit n=1 Tax=Opitutus sp. GAS368 TaxID=1882749 RepID=UPI00087CC034|nr:efflux transporter outer membrane subunit [Opitutus sp. GAS368]SDS65619.1 efflux transporter, outer membrane factor (OMF) lipoprotein, NodT family [Opitutus sp. GAS368]